MIVKKNKSLFRGIAFRILHPVLEKYLSKERIYKYENINITVFPGVFHPGFFFSTKLLLKFLKGIKLKDKYILELGAGTGLISIFASQKGGFITASDISMKAVENIEQNSKMNNANVEVVHSDLFDKIPQHKYDYIIINPPYYKKAATTEKEFAWFAGDDFQYFRKLFEQLGDYLFESTNVLMILSDETDIEMIKSIAMEYNFELDELHRKKIWGEQNFIFNVMSIAGAN